MNEIMTVEFHDDTLFALRDEAGTLVAVKPISDRLGLAWHGQFERLKRDPILAEGIRVIRTPSPGGPQETVCLRLDLIHGWLFTIDHDRVKPELRERVLLYKRECYRVLAEHFSGSGSAVPAAAQPASDIDRKLAMVAEARLVFGKEVAQRMWINLGLETVAIMPGYTTTHLSRDLASFARDMTGPKFSTATMAVLIV